MILIEQTHVDGWEPAIRGMRNPKNSWHKSDSKCTLKCIECSDAYRCDYFMEENGGFGRRYRTAPNGGDSYVGEKDHELMMTLAKGGPTHAKYRRMIIVTADITAPLYWWKEYDTYKVGTVANSCSTMHKIHDRDLELSDFSTEHLNRYNLELMGMVIRNLNQARQKYLETKNKDFWWQMIQLLPTSYNQKRTIQLSYEVLAGIYPNRKDHRLTEWHVFCDWIKSLPYSELITLEERGQT